MNGQQRPRRIVVSALAAALAVLVMASGDAGVSAETKTRYPGYQGPDLEAHCGALGGWGIDTATYPECGPGGLDTDECSAQSAEGCWLQPRPEVQEAVLY